MGGTAATSGDGRQGFRQLVACFLGDRSGNYGLMTAVAMIPILGGAAIAVDVAEMHRQKQVMLNALDAAGVATAREVVTGATDDELKAYARAFFEANLGSVDPAHTNLVVDLPEAVAGGEKLKLTATLDYHPYFLPGFRTLIGQADEGPVEVGAEAELRLKNTLEVALVLDNSLSMTFEGAGSGEPRIDLLKYAAKELVETLAEEAAMIKQVDQPVRFSLVPFASSVNVGPANADAAWMDTTGVSPLHHENFDWTTLSAAKFPDRYAEPAGNGWVRRGAGWGTGNGQPLTRFTLFDEIKRIATEEVCVRERRGRCVETERVPTGEIARLAPWAGCVEARPHPYNINDAPASREAPETLFVPMFAPDEPGDRWKQDPDDEDEPYPLDLDAYNNWWNDGWAWDDPGYETAGGRTRLVNMAKYFEVMPAHAPEPSSGKGPNQSCTTNPITPLTDVTTEAGLATIKGAIDAMMPLGGTNVPEGMAWGWRTVSSGAPFTEGRPDTEKGNDKIVIVLTDGENTYYTPESLGAADAAGTESTYSSYGYVQPGYAGSFEARLFRGTSEAVGRYDYTRANYSEALDEHLTSLCDNAKAKGIIVMTVGLDLDPATEAQADQIEGLRYCASESRFRRDPADPTKGEKLFWNATGATLAEDFEEIADELSNLRIVG